MHIYRHTFIHLFIHLQLYSPLLDPRRFFTLLISYTVGRTPSQGRYLHIGQHKHIKNAQKTPCFEWDSNPRHQCSRGQREFTFRQRGQPLWVRNRKISLSPRSRTLENRQLYQHARSVSRLHKLRRKIPPALRNVK
jgi:hypothetical protein